MEKTAGLKNKSLGIAGFFAYLLIALNTISGFLIGPFLVKNLGKNIYGVYTTMHSFSAALAIVDLGVTQTLIRYVSNYRMFQKTTTDISRLCKTVKLLNYITVCIAIVVSLILYFNIPFLYSNSFTAQEILTAKKIYILFAGSIIFTLLSNYYSGIIAGYGYFTFINITKIIRVVFRLLFIFVIIRFSNNIYFVASIDLALSILLFIIDFVFQKGNIKLENTKGYVSKSVIKEITVFTLLCFLQSLIDQLNSNLDNILIGAVIGSSAVTIYSFGLTIYSMFGQFSISINQMLIPHMTEIIKTDDTPIKFEKTLINIGRIQFSFIGAILFGFIALGEIFINLWLGKNYKPVWMIAVILMASSVLPLVTNGVISILKAKNKLVFRTFSLLVMAVINGISTYFLIKYYGYFYACVGTALGTILVNTIIMYIYYWKELHLNMLKIVFGIIYKILPCNIVPCFIIHFIFKKLPQTYFLLILGVISYLIIYCILLWFLAITKTEKKLILKKLGI